MSELSQLDTNNLPRHIAIIMDGNGRWARERGLPRIVGHKTGVKTVQEIVRTAREIGVRVLTLYAFSTENWQRPAQEVQTLMGLLKSYLQSELEKMVREDIRLSCIGEREKLPEDVQQLLNEVMAKTAHNSAMVLNLALSYGGRNEIIRAVRSIAEKSASGALEPGSITEATMEQHLDTAGLPDPDLLIRTGGEFRLSNFLLWQISYAELYMTETKWPDFDRDVFVDAIQSFQQRQRRFGKTGEQTLTNPGA